MLRCRSTRDMLVVAGPTAVLSILVGGPAVSFSQTPASLDVRAGTLHLTVDDPRPLARAVELLQSRCHCVITYEDPAYAHETDVRDMTVRPEFGHRALSPRGGSLEFTQTLLQDDMSDIRPLLDGLIAEYTVRGYPGAFRVEQHGSVTHVMPTAAKDARGQSVAHASPLDVSITVPEDERTGMQTLEAVVDALRKTSGARVEPGMLPLNLLMHSRVRFGAENEPARQVLIRLFQALGRQASWRLLYDPGWKRYALNIRVLSATAVNAR